jgi:RNA-directed DNA polymerase
LFSFFTSNPQETEIKSILARLDQTNVDWLTILADIKGKKRKLVIPNEESMFLFKEMLSKISMLFETHPSCFSYQKGRSYLDMVYLHKENPFLLKMDLNNFYANISENDIKKVLLKKLSVKTTKRLLRYLLTPDGGLPTGSPVSPYLSNLVLHEFDEKTTKTMALTRCVYTRYSDDLFFSSQNPERLKVIPTIVKVRLAEYTDALKINQRKTKFFKAPYKIGAYTVNVCTDISLKKSFKRKLRVLIHKYSLGELEDAEIPSLKGSLLYCAGNDWDYFEKLSFKYKIEIDEILKTAV